MELLRRLGEKQRAKHFWRETVGGHSGDREASICVLTTVIMTDYV